MAVELTRFGKAVLKISSTENLLIIYKCLIPFLHDVTSHFPRMKDISMSQIKIANDAETKIDKESQTPPPKKKE